MGNFLLLLLTAGGGLRFVCGGEEEDLVCLPDGVTIAKDELPDAWTMALVLVPLLVVEQGGVFSCGVLVVVLIVRRVAGLQATRAAS